MVGEISDQRAPTCCGSAGRIAPAIAARPAPTSASGKDLSRVLSFFVGPTATTIPAQTATALPPTSTFIAPTPALSGAEGPAPSPTAIRVPAAPRPRHPWLAARL